MSCCKKRFLFTCQSFLGERDPLLAAEERYKRLDWGWYIGTIPGRFSQMWKKTERENWRD